MSYANKGLQMNWIETIAGACALFWSGMMIARKYTTRFIDGIGTIAVPEQAMAGANHIAFGGVVMTVSDFWVMLLLTAVSSAVAAGMRFKQWISAIINWAIGVFFGFIGAYIVIFMWRLDPQIIFGLAPAIALFAAKITRSIIYNDEVLGSLFSRLPFTMKK